MVFKMPEKLRKELYNRRYLEYKGKRVHVTDFKDKSLGVQDIKELRLNRHVLGDICEKMTDEALESVYNDLKDKCDDITYKSVTYNEVIINVLMPEILKRLRYKKGKRYKGVYYINDIRSIKENKKDSLEIHYVYVGEKVKKVMDFKDYSVTREYYEQMKMNSYARDRMYKKLDNEAFIYTGRRYVEQCGGVYDGSGKNSDVLIHGVFTELLDRLDEG